MSGAPAYCLLIRHGPGNITKTLPVDRAPHDIRVNAIATGLIEVARFWKQFPNYEQTFRRTRVAKVPLGRGVVWMTRPT